MTGGEMVLQMIQNYEKEMECPTMKTKVEKKEIVKKIGEPNPVKVALYDNIAQYLADKEQHEIYHVKPRSYKDESTGRTKKTGSYGLAFEKDGTVFTLEIVAKNDATTLDNFVVEATTTPEPLS